MKIIILSDDDILGEEQTSSVAIRQLFIANKLSHTHKVTIATTFGRKRNSKKNGIQFVSGFNTLSLVNNFDAVIVELSSSISSIAYAYASGSYKRPTIVDSHYAIIFEKLITILSKELSIFWQKLEVIKKIIEKGDHFICATPQQRDYFLGLISLTGKINPDSFSSESISILPNTFDTYFDPKKKTLRKKYFTKNDKIIISLGGIYPWFNPNPLIQSMPEILLKVKNAKLLILGGKHPSGFYNYGFNKAVDLSKKLNLFNKSIKFINWVAKEASFAYTSEADLSVLISKNSLEDEFAYRTLILTPLLLGVPTITTGKDYISGLIREYQAGAVLPNKNPETISREITRVLLDKKLRVKMSKNTKIVINHVKKDIDIKPLAKFLEDPKINPIFSKQPKINWYLEQTKSKISKYLFKHYQSKKFKLLNLG